MAIFKCKMCGAELSIVSGTTVTECEYCSTKQTLPKLGDDRRANLYDRANHFRRNNEFDKAMGIYEQILSEDNSDAEAYWSLVLCRYGIEYVEDPTSHKRLPTVNRAQFTSVFDDVNYHLAIENADPQQKEIYEQEADAINEIQKGILSISQKEEPFDVFICYKESDANGRRTPDSVLAQELYYQLKEEGFKVFFSRITLEDKLGSAYEPYIFAALNSAKVMVVLGTRPDYFNAVWVKNEWSRYLGLIKQGQKKMLIPAYRDMNPYDLPEEFSHLQAQDMSKLGFMQDLVRGIKKMAKSTKVETVKEPAMKADNVFAVNPSALIKRVYMFLEDGEWKEADTYCERVLDFDAENAEAYICKLMAELKVDKIELIPKYCPIFPKNVKFQRAFKYASAEFRAELCELIYQYGKSKSGIDNDADIDCVREAKAIFESIIDYKDSAQMADQCNKKVEDILEKERLRIEEENRRIEEITKKEKVIARKEGIVAIAALVASVVASLFIVFVGFPISNAIKGDYSTFINMYRVSDFTVPFWVTSIDDSMFEGCTSLENITIPDGVTHIGKSAFDGCINLKKITIPDSVTSIGSFAFENCESLESINIPDGVTNIGYAVFSGCSNLETVNIPNSVKSIDDCAFMKCGSIKNITIPGNVTSIGKSAFEGCQNLQTITIPASVKQINSYAFYNCKSLQIIYYRGNAYSWNMVDIADFGNSNLINADISFNCTK